jgi:hypothetical protein
MSEPVANGHGEGHGDGNGAANAASTAPIPLAELVRLYLVLQVGAGLLLAAAFGVLAALRPLFSAGDASFLRSWLVTFVLAPITFVPVLARWNRWTLARLGRKSSWVRFLAELALFVEVVACVVLQRIA